MNRYSGSISHSNEEATYHIKLQGGKTYLIDLRGTGSDRLQDPFLSIIGDNGQFAENDNGGAGKHAQLFFEPTRTQYYDISVSGHGGAGDYALDVNVDDFRNGPTGLAPAGEAPTDGRSHHGTINYEGDKDVFAVSLIGGLSYNFRMLSGHDGTEDPKLTLLSAGGDLIRNDNDTGDGKDALISCKAHRTGDYWLQTEDEGDHTGTYAVRASVGRGSPLRDKVIGTESGDFINVLAGDDRVRGGAGNDQIWGASGEDTLAGEDGADRISGGLGGDKITGDPGSDRLFGEGGKDHLDGGDGGDLLDGGDNRDLLLGGLGADNIFGGLGNDRVDGGDGRDSLDGGDGNDIALGGTGSDSISGGLGNDRLDGGDGGDSIFGGEGNDTVAGGAGSDFISDDLGNDRLDGGDGRDTIYGGDGEDRVIGGFGGDDLNGDDGDDRLFGNEDDDSINGWSGNDRVSGGQGNDRLFGGEGDDVLRGGANGDFYVGDDGQDVFVFARISDSLIADPDEIDGFDRQGLGDGDLLDLARIDADRTTPGDQTLVFGTGTGKGAIWLENDTARRSTVTLLYINTDNDDEAEFLLRILDGRAHGAADYSDDDLIL